MPLHARPMLLFEYPAVVQSSIWLYYKFLRFPHVVLDQFVCIAQEDYWRILNHVEKNTHKVEEEGEIVMVKEHRELDRSGTRKGHIVIKVGDLLLFFIYFFINTWARRRERTLLVRTVHQNRSCLSAHLRATHSHHHLEQ